MPAHPSALRDPVSDLREQGMAAGEIARLLGRPRSTIEALIKRMGAPLVEEGDDETPREARQRIARDITAGARCPRCHLLRPCDHG